MQRLKLCQGVYERYIKQNNYYTHKTVQIVYAATKQTASTCFNY